MIGLSEDEIRVIVEVLMQFPEIEEAILFGSRAKGNYKKGSDVDIVLKGRGVSDLTARISGMLNDETPLPYFFDVLAFEALDNQDLIGHIERVGISFYRIN